MNLTCSDPEARQHQPGFYGELLPSESVRCGNSSDTSSVSTSLAPSAVGEEEFEDAETDDDDDTIEEESIISMPRARGPPSILYLIHI